MLEGLQRGGCQHDGRGNNYFLVIEKRCDLPQLVSNSLHWQCWTPISFHALVQRSQAQLYCLVAILMRFACGHRSPKTCFLWWRRWSPRGCAPPWVIFTSCCCFRATLPTTWTNTLSAKYSLDRAEKLASEALQNLQGEGNASDDLLFLPQLSRAASILSNSWLLCEVPCCDGFPLFATSSEHRTTVQLAGLCVFDTSEC